ncbi:MAG: ribonuclease III domain-containing protein [Cetobacterium sp.]|uniref:Mini-ribonuclease 3 n=1 Tax=unclassified Cetobacterium TaxID=2630983 RepID=UPI00163C502C|nr:ribonuclease III domain-containing protein [Cetobacterium sp. 2A]MBC2856100.1 Mini-ribonuclease 3-like protein [Cetobacterium sp. 2A]
MVNLNLKEANGLVLAYLGDGVWELMVRIYFINKGYGLQKTNKFVKDNVNAKAQSKILKGIMETLDEKYVGIVNRAKNSNIKTFPKSCTVMEYKEATAFEALIGAMYVDGDIEGIESLIKINLEGEI